MVTALAFDDRGTLYVLHANHLYVSFNRGESFRFVHTLPRFGNDSSVADPAAGWFVVDGGAGAPIRKELGPTGCGHRNFKTVDPSGVEVAFFEYLDS